MNETILHDKKIIDVVKYRWVWFGLSLLLIVPGLVAMAYSVIKYPTHFPVKVGIDFTGGNITSYTVSDKVRHNEIGEIRTNIV